MIYLSFILAIIAAAVDGIVEGFEFDGRKSFERKYGVGVRSFWGSQSWRNLDTKWEHWTGVFDFYHVADDLRSYGYRVSGVLMGYSCADCIAQGNWWHFVGWLTVYFALGILAKRYGMIWIRE